MKKNNCLKKYLTVVVCICILMQLPLETYALADADTIKIAGTENISRNADSTYAMVYDGQSTAVSKKEISFADGKKINTLIESEELPSEVTQSIQENYERAKSLGIDKDVEVVIYAPEKVSESGNNNPGISTLSNDATTYYTYKNTKMKNYQVVYRGLSTGFKRIKNGKDASKFASQIPDLVLLLGSCASSKLKVASFGASLLQIFLKAFGSDFVTGNKNDFIELDISYDKVDQWTYAKLGNSYSIGLFSQKVTITEANIKQYYYNAKKNQGKSKLTSKKGLSKVMKGTHYSSPWATAYTFAGSPRNENVTAKWGNKTYYF